MVTSTLQHKQCVGSQQGTTCTDIIKVDPVRHSILSSIQVITKSINWVKKYLNIINVAVVHPICQIVTLAYYSIS